MLTEQISLPHTPETPAKLLLGWGLCLGIGLVTAVGCGQGISVVARERQIDLHRTLRTTPNVLNFGIEGNEHLALDQETFRDAFRNTFVHKAARGRKTQEQILLTSTHLDISIRQTPAMAEITISNSLREKMLRDEVAYTLSVKLVRSVELPMMAKTAGFDGILIDMEHSSFDLDTTSQICIAALYAGITPIVRVPSKDPFFVSRVLDGGALGVIVPHIRSVQDAKDVVTAAKFQPQGHRSSTNNLPHFQYRALAAKKANPVVNANTLVIPMVETLEAVECVEELAALDGVDSLLIGTNDMTAEMGIPGDYENPRLTEVYEKTIAACKKHGKWVGIGGLHSRLDLVEKFCTMGARWVMAATDGPLLLGGATKRAGEMAQLNGKVKAATAKFESEPKNKPNGLSNGVKNKAVDVRIDELAIDVR